MIKKLLLTTMLCASAFGFSQQLTNSGFENWTSGNPNNWGSLDAMLTANGVSGTTLETQVSPGHSGTSACQLKTQTIAALAKNLPGVICSGPITLGGSTINYGGIPYNFNPTGYTFFYKFAPAGVDTAGTETVFTKWNTGTNSRDTLGIGALLFTTTTASFTQATVTINWLLSGTPDSCTMIFISSVGKTPQVNTTFIIDDVNMAGVAAGISQPFMLNAYSVYPNPATDVLNIVTKNERAAKVQIYDAIGRLIDVVPFENNKAQVNTQAYNTGFYIYRIVDAQNAQLTSSRFSVAK